MKITKWLALLFFMGLCMLISGCESGTTTPTALPAVTRTATVSILLEESPLPSRTPEPTAVPTVTPTTVATDIPLELQLDCGDVFCQVDWPGLLSRPISGEYRNTIDLTYPYANTRGGELEAHHGVEFPNAFGTPVRAAADGVVVFSGDDGLTLLGPYTGFYGNVVIVQHPNLYQDRDLFSLYAHLSERSVEEGDRLQEGEVLGKVGATGAADGSHLHFEVRIDENDYGRTLNPVLWFAPVSGREGTQSAIIAGKILDPYGMPLSEFDFVLEKQEENAVEIERYYPMTYVHYGVNAHPLLDENFVLPDLPPGEYRLAFIAGRFYEFEFTLNPGELGLIQIQLD